MERGVLLMKAYVDDVHFERGGSEVRTRKRARNSSYEIKFRDLARGCGRGMAQSDVRRAISAGRKMGVIGMLRITIAETATEQSWTLEGRLVGPWVAELKTTWQKTHRTKSGQACIVDLNQVTFIDKGGERLLRSMSKQGVRFVASGLYVKHVLDQLKPDGKHGLLKLIFCFFAALLGGVIVPLSCMQTSPERAKTNGMQCQNYAVTT